MHRSTIAGWMVCVALSALPCAARAREEAPALDVVLERLARVAELYRDEALGFTCDEKILFSSGSTALHQTNRYIYRVLDGRLQEYREPIGKTAAGRSGRRNASDPIAGLNGILLRPYSWIFVFSAANQGSFRYTMEGEARVLGTAALRVRFEGVAPYVEGVDEWVGTAFVDRQTFQPLRVEAYQVTDRVNKTTLYTTDFDVVEHGMCFPGQVRIRSPRRQLTLSANQTYKRYRFYGVRTREEIQRFVLGAD